MNRKFANGIFIFILCLGFFLSIFRGFGVSEKTTLTVPTNDILESSSVKSVYAFLHRDVNKDTGEVKETVNRYQHMTVVRNDVKKDLVVLEITFENSAKSDIDYDMYKAKLVLENGKKVLVNPDFSASFEDVFRPGYTQIGNLAFNTSSREIKCIEFPDGSVCGL